MLVPATWRARRRAVGGRRDGPCDEGDPLPYALRVQAISAAALLVGSALIHFAVVPQHVAEHLPFGIAFIMVGTAQVAVASIAPHQH